MHNIPVSDRRGGFLVVVLFAVIGLVSCGSSQGPVSPTSPVMPDPPAPVLDGPMLTVPADQAQARIRRKPFRLEITDAQGAVALSQVENPDAGPMPIVSVVEPAPLGGELPKTPTLYAPLFFVVGITQTPQLPAGPWAANVATGTAVGIAYHATEVLQAMRQGSDRRHLAAALRTTSARGALPQAGLGRDASHRSAPGSATLAGLPGRCRGREGGTTMAIGQRDSRCTRGDRSRQRT